MNTLSYEEGLLNERKNKNTNIVRDPNSLWSEQKATGYVYVKIDSYSLGSFAASESATIKAAVTTRQMIKLGLIDYVSFHKAESINHTWSFHYRNKQKSSFIILLAKQRIFGGNKEIGEIELKLDAFDTNKVTTHEFELRSPSQADIPAKVKLSIHVCEDESPQFVAQQSNNIGEI